MGRHASDVKVQLTVRVPRGHDGFWAIMRELRRFTVGDVEYRSNVHKKTVRDFVGRLARAGYIEHTAWRDQAKVYEIVKDQPEAPKLRRDGSPAIDRAGVRNEQMWRAMKMLGQFTVAELAVEASTETHPIKHETAKAYCKHLYAAGYLAVPRRAQGGQYIYKLRPDMNTGPKAPEVQRTKFVFDPNLGRPVGGEATAGGDS